MSSDRRKGQNSMSGFDREQLRRLRDVMAGHVHGTPSVAWRGSPPVAMTSRLACRLAHPGRTRSGSPRQHLSHRLDDETDRRGRCAAPRRGVRAARWTIPSTLCCPSSPIGACWSTGAVRSTATPCRRSVRSPCTTSSRSGSGSAWTSTRAWPQPLLDAMDELGLGSGPPEPQGPPAPDEWMRRLSTLPLLYQPGERWLYNAGADVLGVLIARAAGSAPRRVPAHAGLRSVGDGRHRLRDRVILERLGSCYTTTPRPASEASSTHPTASGRRRPRSPPARVVSCPHSTTCTPLAGCCCRAGAWATARGCCRARRSTR